MIIVCILMSKVIQKLKNTYIKGKNVKSSGPETQMNWGPESQGPL